MRYKINSNLNDTKVRAMHKNMKWTRDNLFKEALKFKSKIEFIKEHPAARGAAKKLGIWEKICQHMARPNIVWTKEKISIEALKYSTRTEFRKNSNSSYNAARKMCILDLVSQHMPKHVDQSGENAPRFKWTLEKLTVEALKYKTRKEFSDNSHGAYCMARKNGVLNEICSHMPLHAVRDYSGENNPSFKWAIELIKKEALKYSTRSEFQKSSGSSYIAAIKNGILDEACNHMKTLHGISLYEKELLFHIRSFFPTSKTLRKRRIKIQNKSYIRGFDIDIFIPELNLGIEFDGTYYHSFEYMRKDEHKILWSDEDIRNYHEIKDSYFLETYGIKILHIKEEEWKQGKEDCIQRCLDFLRIK